MIGFLFKRLLWMALTLWAVFTVSFFLMRSVPGGPFSEERKIDPYALEVFEARYNLDEPLPVQYWLELKRTVWHGDLGLSIRKVDYTVSEIIAEGLVCEYLKEVDERASDPTSKSPHEQPLLPEAD